MIFSTLIFITVFLPFVLLLSWLLERGLRPLRIDPWPFVNAALLGASLFFYFWGEGLGVLWLCASIVFNDVLARVVSRCEAPVRRKAWLALAIVGNLAFLGWFKYAGFAAASVNLIPGVAVPVPKIALPLGISFYTFQAMSYVVDVYRGDVRPARGILNFACYITMFPQLVAGPIVRYVDIERNLVSRDTSPERVASGMRRFLCGLVKKAVVANTVAEYADAAWRYADAGILLPVDAAWLAVIAYTLQIYYDFSGYSDMAIGIGRMLGFEFLENFRHPYAAVSVREFWRRWHISLSTWFRDYLYIPLGGNRKGVFRTCLNSLIVFALCGLWHGASKMFVIWGLWHGLFLMLERLVVSRRGKGAEPLRGAVGAALRFLGHLYATSVFMAGWVLFRSETAASAKVVFKSLFGLGEPGRETAMLYVDAAPKFLVALVLGAVFSYPVVPALRERLARRAGGVHPAFNALAWLGLTLSALFALLLVAGGSYNPFIYFRF